MPGLLDEAGPPLQQMGILESPAKGEAPVMRGGCCTARGYGGVLRLIRAMRG
jgi:hypothetical protein